MEVLRVCAFVLTVLPLSSQFTGQISAAVPNIQVSSCVSLTFDPVFTVCEFVELVSGPDCCLHPHISIWTGVVEIFSPVSHLCLFLATSGHRWQGRQEKGRGASNAELWASGMRTPSPTPSASGSVPGEAETELASGMSYDVPMKVLRVGVAESVADVAALSDGVRQLEVSPLMAGVDRLLVSIGNLRVIPTVRAQLLGEVKQMRGCLERAEGVAVEVSHLRRVRVEKDGEAWDAASEVRRARVERDKARGELDSERAVAGVELGTVRGELALVRDELESVRKEVGVVATERDEARREAAHWSMQVDKFVEKRRVCDKEHERLLQEGFDLRAEIERLKSGKILRGKDKGTRLPALPPPIEVVEVGVQAEVPRVSTVSLQTDVSRVQVVRKTTYASVASQACPEVAPAGGGVDVEMGGMGWGSSGPPPVPVVPASPVPVVI